MWIGNWVVGFDVGIDVNFGDGGLVYLNILLDMNGFVWCLLLNVDIGLWLGMNVMLLLSGYSFFLIEWMRFL